MKKLLITIGMIFALVGCGTIQYATKEQDAKVKEFKAPSAGKSGLYIFRDSFIGQEITKAVFVDGEVIGYSIPDTFFYKEVMAGEHKISTESALGYEAIIINTESQKNYFIDNYFNPGLLFGGSELKQVDQADGESRIKYLNLLK